jgi:hypothetical protein
MGLNAEALLMKGRRIRVDYSDLLGEEAFVFLRAPSYLQYLDLQHAQLLIEGEAAGAPEEEKDAGASENGKDAKKLSKLETNERSKAVLIWLSENLSNLIVGHNFDIKKEAELARIIIEDNDLMRRTSEAYFPFLQASAEAAS